MDLNNIDDHDDFESEIRTFYETRLPDLHQKRLYLIPHSVLREIAVMIHSKLLYAEEWRDFAALMGINDNLTLDKIKVSAKVSEELPIYVALNTSVPGCPSLGQVVQALLNKDRLDILHRMRSFVTDL